MAESHIRIDEGIKRGPRKKVNRMPKAAINGQFLPKFTPEKKQEILLETYKRLEMGETTEQIASTFGLTGRGLRHWLLDDPMADQARRMLINGELARTLDEMKEAKHAESPLPLACAREEFRAWSWIAERRESRLYGPKQEVTHHLQPVLNINTSSPKLIEGEVVADTPNAALLPPESDLSTSK